MTTPITISADGKCSTPLEHGNDAAALELIIDGNVITGGADSPTLLGSTQAFLPASVHYRITHFEPLDGGKCRVSYERLETTG